MFGFNEEQVYRDEIGELNNRRTDIKFDLGDQFRQAYGALIGKDYSREGLLKGAAKIKNQQLTDAYGGRAQLAQQNLGPLTASYTGVEGKTEKEIQASLLNDESRVKALQDVQASNPNLDISTLSPTANAGAIYGASGKATKQATETKEKENRDRIKAETRRQEKRADDRYRSEVLREDRKDERARLERLENKRSEIELRRDNMNLEYARMERADRRDAQARKDKAIMTLISGLGNLGAAFTV